MANIDDLSKKTKEKLDAYLDEIISSNDYDAKIAAIKQGYGLERFIGDDDIYVRVAVAQQGFGLDTLVTDDAWQVRTMVAHKGHKLDELVNDKDWQVRVAVAEQGYGLDVLAKDKDKNVIEAVARQGYAVEEPGNSEDQMSEETEEEFDFGEVEEEWNTKKRQVEEEILEDDYSDNKSESENKKSNKSKRHSQEKPTVQANVTKVSNSPYFGDGTTTVYSSKDMSPEQLAILNNNEHNKIIAEVKINKLCDERKQLLRRDRRQVKGFWGLIRNLTFRPLRRLLFFIARPLVENWGIFKTDKKLYDLKKEINKTKDDFYGSVVANDRLLKKCELERTQDLQSEKGTDAETQKESTLSKIIHSMSPAHSELKLVTDLTTETPSTFLVMTSPKFSESIGEIKFTIGEDGSLTTDMEDVSSIEGVVEELQSRVAVAKQMEKIGNSQEAITEELWNEMATSKDIVELMSSTSSESQSVAFNIDGMKGTIDKVGDKVVIDVLGCKMEFSDKQFSEQPREIINFAIQQTAVNKYMSCVCERLPEQLAESQHFQKVLSPTLSVLDADIKSCTSGRSVVSMPVVSNNATIGNIVFDTNNGHMEFQQTKDTELSLQQQKDIENLMGTIKGIWAQEIIPVVPAEYIYSGALSKLIEQDIQKEIEQIRNGEKESGTLTICGQIVNITQGDSGVIKVQAFDPNTKEGVEFPVYDNISDGKIDEIIGLGIVSLQKASTNFERQETIASRIADQVPNMGDMVLDENSYDAQGYGDGVQSTLDMVRAEEMMHLYHDADDCYYK